MISISLSSQGTRSARRGKRSIHSSPTLNSSLSQPAPNRLTSCPAELGKLGLDQPRDDGLVQMLIGPVIDHRTRL